MPPREKKSDGKSGLPDGRVAPGRGPKPGEGGRPPSEVRQRLRGSFADRIRILEQIADDPKASAADRMRAVDLLAKYGLGTTQEVTGKDGSPLNPEQRVGRLKQLLGIG